MTIEYLDMGMDQIAPGDPPIELVQGGFQFLEGPVWDRRRGILIFSDIPGQVLYQYRPGDGVSVYREQSPFPNGNTIDHKGRLLTCEHVGRRVVRQEEDGALTPIATHFEGRRLNSPNDIVVRGDGAVYFTDPPYGLRPPHGVDAEKELPFNGVYRLDRDGHLTLLVDDFERPNGLAFSPTEQLLYIDDTARGHIRVFTVTDDGRLQDDRVFAVLRGDGRGRPDGMKVDRDGNVYCTGPGGVWIISPLGGLLGRIRMPEPAANLAWGGDDWRTLYLTATTSLYQVRLGIPGIPAA
ncbi:MAG: SMP-30/gluconolactonase/LRE family protein [Dehalococcoidia bacterium]